MSCMCIRDLLSTFSGGAPTSRWARKSSTIHWILSASGKSSLSKDETDNILHFGKCDQRLLAYALRLAGIHIIWNFVQRLMICPVCAPRRDWGHCPSEVPQLSAITRFIILPNVRSAFGIVQLASAFSGQQPWETPRSSVTYVSRACRAVVQHQNIIIVDVSYVSFLSF